MIGDSTTSVIDFDSEPGGIAYSLAEVIATFESWLHLPDPGALLAVLGTVAANVLPGDPVWTLVVGPPGGGKSELLGSVSSLPQSHPCATLTEAALLSGTPQRDRKSDAKGGLLRSIGDFGIIVAKDFGSVLSMNRDARALVLAALREVYDGSWTRHVGTDGGRTLSWSGKVGLVAGCTPTIDRHHAVMGSMGERFVLYRLPAIDANEQARRALRHAGQERRMRAELASVVGDLFASGLKDPERPSDEEIDRLITLATLVVRCRSAVERDGQTREIELVPEPEAPARLVLVLERLLAGLGAIGVRRDVAWQVVEKAALDSVPALRLAVLVALHAAGFPLETGSLAVALRYPTTTVRRAAEDLTAHGLVLRESGGQGKADRWTASDFTLESFAALTFPEMSTTKGKGKEIGDSNPRSDGLSPIRSDVSGTVDEEEIERLAALSRNGTQPVVEPDPADETQGSKTMRTREAT